MKKLFLAVTVCLCCLGSSLAHAVTVAAGHPLTLSFSNLPFVGTVDNCCQSGASVFLAGDVLQAGDNIRLEFFENTLSETPAFWDFNENTWTVPDNSFGAGVASAGSAPPWTGDLQGAIRLISLSGSINVDHIIISALPVDLSPGLHPKYSQTFYFPSEVPLPATLPLLASALGGLGFLGWLRRRASAA